MSRWPDLDTFLSTDPADVGCDAATAVVHLLVEARVADSVQAERTFAAVLAHLRTCGPCGTDYEGLLAAVELDRRG